MKAKSIVIVILLGLVVSTSSFGEKDYTFCWGSISVTLNYNYSAKQVRYGAGGTIIKAVNGNWKAYGNGGMKTIKIIYNESSEEFSYTLIYDGLGNPSVLVDGQARQYELCKTKQSNQEGDEVAELQNRLKMWDESRRREEAKKNENVKFLTKEIENLYADTKDPIKRPKTHQFFYSIQSLVLFKEAYPDLTTSVLDKYNQLKKIAEKTEYEYQVKENREYPDDYKSYPGLLKEFTNTNGKYTVIRAKKSDESGFGIYYYTFKDEKKVMDPFRDVQIKDGVVFDINDGGKEILRIQESNFYYHINLPNQYGKYNQIVLDKQDRALVNDMFFRGCLISLAHKNSKGDIDDRYHIFYIYLNRDFAINAILALVNLYLKVNGPQSNEIIAPTELNGVNSNSP